ncbi:MAG TPA: NlpC/P60 family protein [Phnomibacter sp.]|nr:NlpC/P60 family protein [Phnomibacter sp.]
MFQKIPFLPGLLLLMLALQACRGSRSTGGTQQGSVATAARVPKAIMPPAPTDSAARPADENFAHTYSQKLGITVPAMANQLLISTIAEWVGVPYRYGGNDKQGVDCSGFINNVYPMVYSLRVPRIAAHIHAQAQPVATAALQEGDLVFFRINTAEVGHAGIYLFDDHFVHATKSRGVMISRLREPYWSKYFVGGGRYTR